jgi:hypothetical protein
MTDERARSGSGEPPPAGAGAVAPARQARTLSEDALWADGLWVDAPTEDAPLDDHSPSARASPPESLGVDSPTADPPGAEPRPASRPAPPAVDSSRAPRAAGPRRGRGRRRRRTRRLDPLARRERIADLLILAGAITLSVSLFLTWTYQYTPVQRANVPALQGIPRELTAWQLYSTADVLLALLAGALVVVALAGRRRLRLGALFVCALALAFTLAALSAPATNGANLFVPGYSPGSAAAGVGETVALAGLGVALFGLLVSFTAD